MKKLKSMTILFITLITLSTWPCVLKTQAAEPGNRFFSVNFSPTAVDVSQITQFTVQITNDPASQDTIGSINLTTPLGFTVITQPVITSPSGAWITIVQNEAKIGMKPSSPQEALLPGQTISIIFYANTPALPGSSTWKTECNTNTGIGGIPFSLAAGAQQPVVVTNSALVAPSINAFPEVVDQGQASSLTSSTVTTGSAPYMYQWYLKGPYDMKYSAVVGGTSSSYTFFTGSSTAVGTWSFLLQVTDSAGATVNSTEAAFMVVNPALAAPLVTASPSAIVQGQTSSLSSSDVTTGTAPYVYQWFRKSPSDSDFAPIDGATSNGYIFSTTASTASGAWSYALRVTDGTEASVTSNTVSITVNPGQYVITASADPNGAISPSGSVYLNNGADQVFTITPYAGYHVVDVLVDGISVGPIASYKFTAVTANHTITASFAIDTFTITVIQGDNGVITPGTSVVNYGDTPSFTITPSTGYHVLQVLIDGSPVTLDGQNKYMFPAVDASHVIAATFTIDTNIITASAGANGAINPNGNVIVGYGADQSFTITAAVYYHISDVVIDGISVGPVASYTFTNVISNHSIQAIFEIDDLTILAVAGPNGTINPSGTVYVGYDGSQTFTFTPAPGYHIADVRVDGNTVGAQNSYTFSHVTKGHTIDVTFTLSQYTITASAGSGGFVNPSGGIAVNQGASQAFTITAGAGYNVAEVSVDGISVGAVGSYTFTDVVADHIIYASFAINQYTITVTSPYGSPTPSALVNEGADFTASVTSTEGDAEHRWVCMGYSVDGGPVNPGTNHTFVNLQANHTVTFSWQEQYYVTIVSPYGTTAGSGWYNSGTNVTVSVLNAIIPGDDGTRHVFNGWSGDASGMTLTSNPIQVDGPKTATTNWKTQYYLTVISERGNPTGQGWYDAGSTAAFSVNTLVSGGSDVRFVFNSWTGTDGTYTGSATSSQVIMNRPITERTTWTTQYQVVYVASRNALQVAAPPVEWINSGAATTNAFPKSVTNAAKDTRCDFVSDDRPAAVTKPVTVTGTYQTQYLLTFSQNGIASDASGTIVTVFSDAKAYEQLAVAIWVNSGGSVAFSYAETVETTDAGKQYLLKGTNATSPLTINERTIVQGNYEPQTSSPLSTIALSALLFLLLALLAILLLARRRKKKVTPIADEGGSISPGTTQKVERGGDSPTFRITARAGYEIADVVIDRITHLGAVKTHQFTNVTKDHVISASFHKI
jgi:hypothetical protein